MESGKVMLNPAKLYVAGAVMSGTASAIAAARALQQAVVLTPGETLVPLGIACSLFVGALFFSVKLVRIWDKHTARLDALETRLNAMSAAEHTALTGQPPPLPSPPQEPPSS